ncbi:MAG: phosphomannomutase/phosphoglucomutase [Candidatus Neoclostridium sp.]
MELKKLKSGTDVRGVALDGYGEEVNLTPEVAHKLALAFVAYLKEKNASAKKIAVGRDSRLSGSALAAAVINAVTESGLDALDCGMCSTPSMFMMTVYDQTAADASVMITASHHPAQKNGLKFFFPQGGAESEDVDKIIAYAEENKRVLSEVKGEVITDDFIGLYCEFLREKVRSALGGDSKPLSGFHFVVDAGNGAGGFYADRVLKELGANVDGSQFLEPDGSFPNHIPNPENKTAMDSVRRCTMENRADLGIIFDTDVDRAAIVAPDGEEINRNRLIALISAIVLRKYPGATVVTDSVTSDGLKAFIESHGGVHHRFKRGYKNVINEAIRLEKEGITAPLAIETSGHAALKDNYFLDDGAYLVTEIIIEAARLKKEGKTVDSLISELACPVEELEVRLSFPSGVDFKKTGAFIIEELKNLDVPGLVVAPDNYEGARVSVPGQKGWFLVRMSVHDPIMPINIESDKPGGAKSIAKILYAYLSQYRDLDSTNLAAAIGE